MTDGPNGQTRQDGSGDEPAEPMNPELPPDLLGEIPQPPYFEPERTTNVQEGRIEDPETTQSVSWWTSNPQPLAFSVETGADQEAPSTADDPEATTSWWRPGPPDSAQLPAPPYMGTPVPPAPPASFAAPPMPPTQTADGPAASPEEGLEAPESRAPEPPQPDETAPDAESAQEGQIPPFPWTEGMEEATTGETQIPPMPGTHMPGTGQQIPPMPGSQMPPMPGPQMPHMPQMPGTGPQIPPMPGPQIPPMPGPQIPGPQMPPMPGPGQVMGPYGPPMPEAQPYATSESLRHENLLRNRKRPPIGGWRRAIYAITGGVINPGDSKAERHRQRLVDLARRPVPAGHYRVAVMSLKGGVGKTTTTIGLGSTLAHHRGDRVIAVDANPDRGTLSEKVQLETRMTVRDLLNDRAHIRRYADVRSFTSQASSRLEVLASDRDPAISEAFNDIDYAAVADILEHHYSICLTDCGTGMLHAAMGSILNMADQIVLVSPVSVDGARSASATLDWLEAHGHGGLARNAVVVLSAVRGGKNAVDIGQLQQHFANRCRAVVSVPFDPHLDQGSHVDLELLRPATRDAYLTLAASVADGFESTGGRGFAPNLPR